MLGIPFGFAPGRLSTAVVVHVREALPPVRMKEISGGAFGRKSGGLRMTKCEIRMTGLEWTGSAGLLLLAAAEFFHEELLFYGLVVGHKDVTDGASADEVADFFG
jgi:hypothetical protein